MDSSLDTISILRLCFALIPAALVLMIMLSWALNTREAIYAIVRMVLQLVAIGYLLVFIFDTQHSITVICVLTVMLVAASWISLNALQENRIELLPIAFVSLLLGSGFTLAVTTQLVLNLDPWFLPRYMVPLAGMTFASAMTTLSLAAERFSVELERGESLGDARITAMKTGMIPVINAMLAVGLVALPGMMTGQILSGVSPLIAVRYQIMIMFMMFGSAGLSAACYLWWLSKSASQGSMRIKQETEQ